MTDGGYYSAIFRNSLFNHQYPHSFTKRPITTSVVGVSINYRLACLLFLRDCIHAADIRYIFDAIYADFHVSYDMIM
ncbi:MAG: hypothetical protein ACI9DQ_001677, partial [Glaciecola sp.]